MEPFSALPAPLNLFPTLIVVPFASILYVFDMTKVDGEKGSSRRIRTARRIYLQNVVSQAVLFIFVSFPLLSLVGGVGIPFRLLSSGDVKFALSNFISALANNLFRRTVERGGILASFAKVTLMVLTALILLTMLSDGSVDCIFGSDMRCVVLIVSLVGKHFIMEHLSSLTILTRFCGSFWVGGWQSFCT